MPLNHMQAANSKTFSDSIPCCHHNKYNCFCTDDEVLEGDWGMYMDGAGSSRCMSDAAAQPSHHASHDDSAKHTSCAQAGLQSPPPTWLSPPLLGGSAHNGGSIFVPTPGRLTLPVVQAEPTQDPSLPNPDEPTAQIEQIQSENIVPVHGLQRSLCTDIHPPGYGTDDGKYHDLWKHLWNPQTAHNYKRYTKLVIIPMSTSTIICPSLLSSE